MKRLKAWRSGVGLILLFWVAGLIAYYFVIHRPWEDSSPAAIGRSLLNCVAVVAIIALGGGIGRRWCAGSGWDQAMAELHPFEKAALQAALGLGIIALLVLAVGILGGAQRWSGWLALGLGLLMLHDPVWGWLNELGNSFTVTRSGSSYYTGWLAGVFIGLVLIVRLLQALAPPVAWDSLAYHLQVPQHYLQAGRIAFYPENLYSGFPQTAEMNYLWAMALGTSAAGGVMSWAVGVLGLLGLEGFSRRLWGEQVAWLAPAFLLTGNSLSRALGSAYVDSWLILFGLGVIVAFERYAVVGQKGWLVIGGVFTGFAIGTKYTAAVLCPAWLGAIIWHYWGEGSNRRLSRNHRLQNWLAVNSIFLFTAGFACLPWFVRNALWSGNPFYPATIFIDRFDPWQQTFIPGAAAPRPFWWDLLLPLEATLFGLEKGVILGKPAFDANIGPLLLAFLPGIWLGWRSYAAAQQQICRLLLAAGITLWVSWAFMARLANELIFTRHYYGLFPAFAVLAVGGYLAFSGLHLGVVRLGRLATTLVLMTLLLSAATELKEFVKADPLPVLTGQRSAEEHLTQQLGWHYLALHSLSQFSAQRVLLLWEPRSLYCTVECLPDATLRNWWFLRKSYGSAANIAHGLQEAGIAAVLVHQSGAALLQEQGAIYQDDDWQEFDQLMSQYFRPIAHFGQVYTLYELRLP